MSDSESENTREQDLGRSTEAVVVVESAAQPMEEPVEEPVEEPAVASDPPATSEQPAAATDNTDSHVKLFFGQIPNTWDSQTLTDWVRESGIDVVDSYVIKSKNSPISRGCAFVTVVDKAEADKAIEKLHDSKTFEGTKNALQVRLKEGEAERLENKLFLGMVPKHLTEADVMKLIEPYGECELTILRDKRGQSKGCAFVKMSTREAATKVISELDGHVIGDAPRGITVKFAESKKEKERRQQGREGGGPVGGGRGGPGGNGPAGAQGGMMGPMGMNPMLGGPWGAMFGGGPPPQGGGGNNRRGGGQGGRQQQQMWNEQWQQMQQQYVQWAQHAQQMGAVNPMAAMAMGGYGMPPQGPAAWGGPNNRGTGRGGDRYDGGRDRHYDGGRGPRNNVPEGPEGANLFVMHLPQHMDDNGLYSLFRGFGDILSASVFIDRRTNQSKGFGFVSFANADQAYRAIHAMHGADIEGKKLKVEIKNPRNNNNHRGGGRHRPY